MLKLITIILAAVSFMTLKYPDCVFGSDEMSKGEWSSVSAGPVTTWTAPLCGKGKFVLQPFVFYNRTRGSFASDGHYGSLPDGNSKYQFQEQLFAQFGLIDRLEIDGQAVYQQNYIKQDDSKSHSSGFGDSYIFMRYCVSDENGWSPHITGVFQLKMPTGKYQKASPDKLGTDLMGAATGGGSWDPGFGINLTKKLKPFIFHGDIAYSYPQLARIDGVKTIYGRYLTWDFGVECLLSKGFNLIMEGNFLSQGDMRQDGGSIPSSDVKYFTMAPGIGWSNDKIQTLLAYQRVMTGANTDANDSIVLTLVCTF